MQCGAHPYTSDCCWKDPGPLAQRCSQLSSDKHNMQADVMNAKAWHAAPESMATFHEAAPSCSLTFR